MGYIWKLVFRINQCPAQLSCSPPASSLKSLKASLKVYGPAVWFVLEGICKTRFICNPQACLWNPYRRMQTLTAAILDTEVKPTGCLQDRAKIP